jgi:hypothetical protein
MTFLSLLEGRIWVGADRKRERMAFDGFKFKAREKAIETGKSVQKMLDGYVATRKSGADLAPKFQILWDRIIAVLIVLVIVVTVIAVLIGHH